MDGRRGAVGLLLVLTLGACTTSSQRSGVSSTSSTAPPQIALSTWGGCADVLLWGVTADGTQAVVAAIAEIRPAPLTSNFVLPDSHAQIEVRRGEALGQSLCNDVLSQDYRLDSSSPAVSGKVHLVLTPLADPGGGCATAHGELTLDDLVLEDGTRVGHVRITTDEIGCYSG